MTHRLFYVLCVGACVGLASQACSDDSSGEGDGDAGGNGAGDGDGDSGTTLDITTSGDSDSDSDSDSENGGGGGGGPVCETVSAAAELPPVYLAFAFDVSGSMGQLDQPRWWHDPESNGNQWSRRRPLSSRIHPPRAFRRPWRCFPPSRINASRTITP